MNYISSSDQRQPTHVYGEKLIDLANIALAALVFGQFVSSEGIHWSTAVAGLMLFIFLYVLAYFFLKSKKGT